MTELKPFTQFTYQTADGQTITASKKNGIVTLRRSDGAYKQMPIDKFWKEFMKTVKTVDKTPDNDTVSIGNTKNTSTKEELESFVTCMNDMATLHPYNSDDSRVECLKKTFHNAQAMMLNPMNSLIAPFVLGQKKS